MQAMAAAPAPLQTSLVVLKSRPVSVQRVDQTGGRNDRRAVLVVVEHRNVHDLAQPLFDDETFGRLDVFQVDAAEGGAEKAHAVDEFVDILGVDFQIDCIDIGKALEQHGLAFHHRLGGERAEIAEAQDRCAVGNDRDHIAAGRVVIGRGRIGGDRLDRNGNAGRIGKRKVALRRHRLGGRDFQLAGPALRMKIERFLVRNAFARAIRLVCFRHVSSSTSCGPRRLRACLLLSSINARE